MLVAGLSLTSQAANSSWNVVNANSQWTNALSWSAGVPGISGGSTSADIAFFTNTLTVASTNTVDANRNIGGITFGNTGTKGYVLNGGSLRLSNGGTIEMLSTSGNHIDTINPAITIQGDGGSATVRNSRNANSGGISLGAVMGVSTLGKTTTLTLDGVNTSGGNTTGLITDGSGGGNLKVIKTGTGTWNINLGSSFTGGFYANQGTVRFNNSTAVGFGGGSVFVADGVVFDKGTATAMSITNKMVVNGNFSMINQAGNTWSGEWDLGSAVRTLTVSADNAILGSISNGGLTKAGASVLTLSGSNTYSGTTTVSLGTLIANADHALGTSNVTVAGGATLTLTGGTANDYVADLAQLVLGTNSVLALNFTGVADKVSGLSLDGGSTWLTNGTYNASALTAAGGLGAYSGTGSLTVIPEPATIGMLGLGALITIMLRRMHRI